jgi:hypothetical protein
MSGHWKNLATLYSAYGLAGQCGKRHTDGACKKRHCAIWQKSTNAWVSWVCSQLWSQKGDLQRAWNQDRRAVWGQVGLSHCRHEGLVMVWDEARLRWGHRNDQSRRGHPCSETTLTGESRFHINPPRGFEPGSLVTGSKQVSPLDQWEMVRMKWDCRLSTT